MSWEEEQSPLLLHFFAATSWQQRLWLPDRKDRLRTRTFNAAAEDLGPQADGAVDVPRLGVDADESGYSRSGQQSQNWCLWVLVPFKDLQDGTWHRMMQRWLLWVVFFIAFCFHPEASLPSSPLTQLLRNVFSIYSELQPFQWHHPTSQPHCCCHQNPLALWGAAYCFFCPIHAGLPADGVVAKLDFVGVDPVPATRGSRAINLSVVLCLAV